MSKQRLWIVIPLISLIIVLFTGCAGHPKGLNAPRQLTDAEKDRDYLLMLIYGKGWRNLHVLGPGRMDLKKVEKKALYDACIIWRDRLISSIIRNR